MYQVILSSPSRHYLIITYKLHLPVPSAWGLMFRLINVSPKHMFHSRKDRSSALQSFSLPYIMFCLIIVSSMHMFWSGEDRSSALQSFSLSHIMFHLVNFPAYYIVYNIFE